MWFSRCARLFLAVLTLSGVSSLNEARASALVHVDHKKRTVTLLAQLVYFGPSVSNSIAKAATDEINRYWNGMTNDPKAGTTKLNVMIAGRPYRFQTRVTYSVVNWISWERTILDVNRQAMRSTDPSKNYIYIALGNSTAGDRSFMQRLRSNQGMWYLSDNLGASTTAPHEFGHALGLDHTPSYNSKGQKLAWQDWRGRGQPGIMQARGAWVDAQYQWNPSAKAGTPGGTIDPSKRRVLQSDIDALRLDSLPFSPAGYATISVSSHVARSNRSSRGQH